MALKIRLKRMGTNKRPVFRLIVVDSRFSGKGRRVQDLGTYDPRHPENAVKNLDWEGVESWRKKGAVPSETVDRLLRNLKKKEAAPTA